MNVLNPQPYFTTKKTCTMRQISELKNQNYFI